MAGISEKLREIRREVKGKMVVSRRSMERLETEAEEAWGRFDTYPALSDEEVFLEAVGYLLLRKQKYEASWMWALDKTEREHFKLALSQYTKVLDADSLVELALNVRQFAQANVDALATERKMSHVFQSWRVIKEATERLGRERGWFQELVK